MKSFFGVSALISVALADSISYIENITNEKFTDACCSTTRVQTFDSDGIERMSFDHLDVVHNELCGSKCGEGSSWTFDADIVLPGGTDPTEHCFSPHVVSIDTTKWKQYFDFHYVDVPSVVIPEGCEVVIKSFGALHPQSTSAQLGEYYCTETKVVAGLNEAENLSIDRSVDHLRIEWPVNKRVSFNQHFAVYAPEGCMVRTTPDPASDPSPVPEVRISADARQDDYALYWCESGINHCQLLFGGYDLCAKRCREAWKDSWCIDLGLTDDVMDLVYCMSLMWPGECGLQVSPCWYDLAYCYSFPGDCSCWPC